MEQALKQRLVGASVIIALAVIFIPMLFDDSQSNNVPISIDIPKEPDNLKHKIVPLDSNSITNSQSNTDEADEPINTNDVTEIKVKNQDEPKAKIITTETIVDLTEEIKPEIKEPKIKPKVKPKVEVADTKQTTKTPKPPKTTVKNNSSVKDAIYRIKLGAFSQKLNAEKLKAKIIHQGLEAHIEKDTKSGLYKVYSRQYSNRQAAENLNAKIQKLHLNLGKTTLEVINKDDFNDAEAQLGTGWIVQIGIFSNKTNSLKLRDKIRKKGFISFVDEVLNSKNKTNYRVRIGPYATREEADTKKKEIFKTMNLKGLLKPHEKKKVVTK